MHSVLFLAAWSRPTTGGTRQKIQCRTWNAQLVNFPVHSSRGDLTQKRDYGSMPDNSTNSDSRLHGRVLATDYVDTPFASMYDSAQTTGAAGWDTPA